MELNPKWGTRVLQTYVGLAFAMHGIQKMLSGWLQNSHTLTSIIGNFLDKIHPALYKTFLTHVVLAHPLLWSRLIAFGETSIGFGLLAGILPRAAAFFGMVLMLSYWLMKGAPFDLIGEDQPYFFIFWTLFFAAESWFIIRRKNS